MARIAYLESLSEVVKVYISLASLKREIVTPLGSYILASSGHNLVRLDSPQVGRMPPRGVGPQEKVQDKASKRPVILPIFQETSIISKPGS